MVLEELFTYRLLQNRESREIYRQIDKERGRVRERDTERVCV